MLEDWEKFGGGIQGDSYYSKSDPNVILKLYSEHISKEYVESEYRFNTAVSENGIKCPKAIRMEQFGNQYGIVFYRVPNKKSFCRAAGENPELTESLAIRLSDMAHDLHSKSSEGTPFKSAYEMYKDFFDTNTLIDDTMRAKMAKALKEIEAEDCHTLLHGDFHFGNAITDGKEDYFIDLGNLSYGNPKFDISMLYLVTHYGTESIVNHNFHLTVDLVMRFWDAFKREYYGREISDSEILSEIKNYLLIRTLWMQKDTGNAPFVPKLMELFASDDCPAIDRSF